jgi:hypothetical protein
MRIEKLGRTSRILLILQSAVFSYYSGILCFNTYFILKVVEEIYPERTPSLLGFQLLSYNILAIEC